MTFQQLDGPDVFLELALGCPHAEYLRHCLALLEARYVLFYARSYVHITLLTSSGSSHGPRTTASTHTGTNRPVWSC